MLVCVVYVCVVYVCGVCMVCVCVHVCGVCVYRSLVLWLSQAMHYLGCREKRKLALATGNLCMDFFGNQMAVDEYLASYTLPSQKSPKVSN